MNFKNDKIQITRKNNKNLYIRVDDDLNIKITCPYFYTDKMIEEVIKENEKCIDNMISKQKQKVNNKKRKKIVC